MTDDIAADLKQILDALEYDRPLHEIDWMGILRDAISRLTTPPLPEEIAGLIEALNQIKTLPANALPSTFYRLISPEMLDKLADALRALAQENERLLTLPLTQPDANLSPGSTLGKLGRALELIGELEAERDLQTKLKDMALQSAVINIQALKQCQLLLCPDFDTCESQDDDAQCACGFAGGPCANAVPKNRAAEAIKRKT